MMVLDGTEGQPTVEIVQPSSANRAVIDLKDAEDPESEESETDSLGKKMIMPEGTEAEEEEDAPSLNFREFLVKAIQGCAAILLVVYLVAAFIIDFRRALALFIATVLVIVWHIWIFWAQKNEETVQMWEVNTLAFFVKVDTERKYGLAVGGLLCLIMVIMMAITVRDGRNLISLLGLFTFISITWIFSWKPNKIKLRPVIGAIFIQFILGYCVIRTYWGFTTIQFMAETVTTLLGYTTAGSGFVFNWLTDGSLFGRPFQLVDGDAYFLAPPFFFNALPSVIFFSAIMSVGYYIRVLPWCVSKFGTF
jgi:pyrimidine nucleoside transport protein